MSNLKLKLNNTAVPSQSLMGGCDRDLSTRSPEQVRGKAASTPQDSFLLYFTASSRIHVPSSQHHAPVMFARVSSLLTYLGAGISGKGRYD